MQKRECESNLRRKKGGIRRNFTLADVEREEREQQRLLKEAGLLDEISGAEAAYDDLTDFELCRDLAGNFARESAKKTDEPIGAVRDRYDTIVMELITARYTQTDGNRHSLGTVLRGKYQTDAAMKEFLPKFGNWIGEYVSECIREHIVAFTPLYRQIVPTHSWTLCGHSVSRQLLIALAEEYVRHRDGVMRFLLIVFKRWRKIFEPQSLWRVRLVTQHHASDVPHHKIVQHLERNGAIPKGSAVSRTKDYALLRSRIKKYRSRDQGEAIKKKILIELRSAGERGLTTPEISERTHVSSVGVSDALNSLQQAGKAKWKWWKPYKDEKRRLKLWSLLKKKR